jgi:hypothetical protein
MYDGSFVGITAALEMCFGVSLITLVGHLDELSHPKTPASHCRDLPEVSNF